MTVITLVPYLFMLVGALLMALPVPHVLKDMGARAFLAGCIGACVMHAGLAVRVG